MPDLKLSRLPDRTPIKLSITVMPDLHQALKDYAEFWGLKRGIAGRKTWCFFLEANFAQRCKDPFSQAADHPL